MPTLPTPDQPSRRPRRPSLRQQLIDTLVPWLVARGHSVNPLELDDLLHEPEVAPLATQLGYLPPPDDILGDIRRVHLRADLERAFRRAQTAEALRLGQVPGVPALTDRAFSLALADAAAAIREATRRLAATEQRAQTVGDAPAEFELERLAASARELAGACERLYESRALRGG